MDDHGLLYRILEWAWVGIVAVGGYVMRNINKNFATMEKLIGQHGKEIDNLKKADADCELNLERFKTHVSENYTTKVDMMGALKMINDSIRELRDDIKNLPNRRDK